MSIYYVDFWYGWWECIVEEYDVDEEGLYGVLIRFIYDVGFALLLAKWLENFTSRRANGYRVCFFWVMGMIQATMFTRTMLDYSFLVATAKKLSMQN